MSDDSSLDDFTLENYNKTLEPKSLRLTEKLDEGGVQTGFILQEIKTGDTWFEIFNSDLVAAAHLTEAFIQGGKVAVIKCQQDIQEFLASMKAINEEDSAPDDTAKATACGKWLRKQAGLKFLDEVSAYLAEKSGGSIVEFVDPKTNLVSHALVDKAGKHEWIIPHEDKAVAALVVEALLGGFKEGQALANFQMNKLQPTITIEDAGGKLN